MEKSKRDRIYEQIHLDSAIRALAHNTHLSWLLTIAVCVVYFAFVVALALHPELLGKPVADGPMYWGIPLGAAVTIFGFRTSLKQDRSDLPPIYTCGTTLS